MSVTAEPSFGVLRSRVDATKPLAPFVKLLEGRYTHGELHFSVFRKDFVIIATSVWS